MNLKYYLRGLGVGIIVTALIMGIASSGRNETLSDSEIKERARALGMTEESTLLADAVSTGGPEASSAAEETVEPAETAAAEETAAPEETAAAEETAAPEETAVAEETVEPVETAAEEETATPQKTPEPTGKPSPTPVPVSEPTPETAADPVDEGGGIITIQVSSGDGSYTVCRKLEEAGLIGSASDFDRYLYENGYDKRLNIGIFEIPEGAGQEQIARILTGIE